MITALAIVFFLGGFVCYISCYAAARADRQSETYFYLKMQEMDAERRNENLKND